MSNLLVTILFAFAIVLIAFALLGLGWICYGKMMIKPGGCGQRPKGCDGKPSKEDSCKVCQPTGSETNEKPVDPAGEEKENGLGHDGRSQ